jgi:DNA-directed RNA polymerase specialized sigma24 family protein
MVGHMSHDSGITQAEIREIVAALMPELRAAIIEVIRQAAGDRLVDCKEAAKIAGCSVGALNKRIARGTQRVIRTGRAVRIRMSDLVGK